MPDIRELNKKIEVSVGALIFTAISLIVGTFTITTIYNEFLFLQKDINKVERRFDTFKEETIAREVLQDEKIETLKTDALLHKKDVDEENQ